MAGKNMRPVVLVVLDGWGYRAETEGGIHTARRPQRGTGWRHAPRTCSMLRGGPLDSLMVRWGTAKWGT